MARRPRISTSFWLWLAWVVALALTVHLDWHLGRPQHMRHSLAWANHWVVGLVFGIALASHVVHLSELHAVRQFLLVALLGLTGGQIVEPLAEMVVFDLSLESVYPDVRWRLFWQFTIAFVVGGAAVLIAQARRAQEALLAARHD